MRSHFLLFVGTSNIDGYTGITTTLVLKASNYCPPENLSCSGDKAHFDIAAPGFDFRGASKSNVCSSREQDEEAGFKSCEFWMINSGDPNELCDCSSFSNPVLENGCENFRTLYWNNPQVEYEEVTCPEELSRLPCWTKNGNQYPNSTPEFCTSNIGSRTTAAEPTTTTETAITTTTDAATTTTTKVTTASTEATAAPLSR